MTLDASWYDLLYLSCFYLVAILYFTLQSKYNLMQRYFTTLGDSRYFESANTLGQEIKSCRLFDHVTIADEYDLDADFVARFKDKLTAETRGFGYWIWKPQIILQSLEKMDWGDLLVYADADFQINPNGLAKFDEYFRLADNPLGMLVMQQPEFFNYGRDLCTVDAAWCKGDLLDYFGVRYQDDIILSGQVIGGYMYIIKNQQSYHLIKEWQNIYLNNFSYIDDSPSISENHSIYIEHRHDQSIFSLLCKTNKVKTLQNLDEVYVAHPIRKALKDKKITLDDYYPHNSEPLIIVGREKKG